MKSVQLTKQVIKSILQGINVAEKAELGHCVSDLRGTLMCLLHEIGGTVSDNYILRQFDDTFETCGWLKQGIRWSRDKKEYHDGRLVMIIGIVEFTTDTKESWEMLQPAKHLGRTWGNTAHQTP